MPIISAPDRTTASINGDADNSFLYNSLDDEESFVVLERSTANDMSLPEEVTPLAQSQNQQNGPTCSFPPFSTYLSADLNSSRISNLSQVQVDPIPIPYDNTNISVSVEEIEKRLQEVLHENINLKENLYQTNLAMKQQLSTVRLLQDRALETQKNHQAKFEETKTLIVKLGSEKNELQDKLNQLNEDLNKIKEENKGLKETNNVFGDETSKLGSEKNELQDKLNQLNEELGKIKEENKELKETNVAFGAEASKLLTENASLKKQISAVQETLETVAEKEKKVSLQQSTAKEAELREVVDQLTRKLEAVERARRQQDFDIDKLQAQIARSTQDLTEAQRKLAHSEIDRQVAQTVPVKNENSLQYIEKLTKYDGLLKQFKLSIQEEQTRFNSLNSWLTMTDPVGSSAQFEISELRHLLAEEQTQSVARKEKLYQAVATIHELLADFQKLGEELERVKADHALKESHGMAYDEMQKKGFRERLDSLTAKFVEKEEALAISERHLASLQEAVRLQNDEKKETGEVNTLKEQVSTLVAQIAAKDEELEVKSKELNTLRTEVQKLNANCDTIAVLEEQAKIYQADFEAERKSREYLAAEKERMLEDLRHLQRRNHELIEELNNSRGNNNPPQTMTLNRPRTAEPVSPRQPERSPSPPPVRKTENMELQINMVFHEKQEGNLCAQHCLNALLQKAHFNAVDLAELAREMDYAEKRTLAEAGVDSQEFQSFVSKPSQNMDETGFFSVQVISCALALWGLEMVPFSSTEPKAIAARKNLNIVKAFICHSHAHWFTIRRVGKWWFNLNSTLEKPQPLSDLYLSLFLIEFEREGNFVFMVFGDLPPCPGDEGETTQNHDELPSTIIEEIKNNIDMMKSAEELRSLQNTLHLVLSEQQRSPTTFTEKIKLLFLNREACKFFGL